MRQNKFVPLKEYIEQCTERNTEGLCGVEDAVGVNIEKQMGPMKAKIDPEKIYDFFMVKPGYFVFNQRGSRKLGIGLNFTNKTLITTYDHVVFKVKDKCKDVLDATFLYILLSRKEFDRYAEYSSWGSSTEYFRWRNMCEVVIPLPSIDEQRKVVNAWKALREIKEQNEAIAAPLMQVCQSYIQELKHEFKDKMVKIGPFMTKGVKNSDGKISKVLGVAQSGFIEPQKIPNPNLRNYKVMDKNAICYAPPLYNILSDAIQLYEDETPAICSPIYEVFYVNEKVINPAFLLMWLKRTEFKRYAEFYSMGVRNTFNYELMEQVEIPLPSLEKQNAIVNIFNCANEAKRIAEEADRKSREVCPALIQHVIHQSEKA